MTINNVLIKYPYMKKKLKFEAVKNEDGSMSVKARLRESGNWYTACDTFCVPYRFNAGELAEIIAKALNEREELT